MYEIFFISYEEPNADSNWQILKKIAPTARRLDGIKGLKLAHKRAAELSFTKMFYVIDGDAEVLDTFNFYRTVENYDAVHARRQSSAREFHRGNQRGRREHYTLRELEAACIFGRHGAESLVTCTVTVTLLVYVCDSVI
jgi:hypothetical protein